MNKWYIYNENVFFVVKFIFIFDDTFKKIIKNEILEKKKTLIGILLLLSFRKT